MFRVDDKFLNSETSGIMIEIYAAAWLRDIQIGSVRVLTSNLFPSNNNNSKMRFVALQVRRPSGRPQGILNMGVQLLDNTMRSMPLYTELSASAVGLNDLIDAKTNKQTIEEKTAKLRRTRSDHTDFSTMLDEFGLKGSSIAKSSVVNGSSLVNYSAVKFNSKEKLDTGNGGNGNGSMVNGSLCSDVGPSASVVAAAIAKGLIKPPGNEGTQTKSGGSSSIIDDWTENDSVEGLRTKLERWKAELPPIYDNDSSKMMSKSRRKHHRRRKSEGLFTCFGNVLGCEISITCGGGKKKHGKKVRHWSSLESGSYL